ncbi:MAG TPA: ABC transporter ATP-binding protein [Acidimicrobiales bacterium]|nr:ABC transporter ATP-binding protein [Acidimicrobiales bacterium]
MRKSYGDRVAVDGVSFDIRPGERYGLLGPNGAGKTTLVSVICGIMRAEAGQVVVERGRGGGPAIGYVPQELAIYLDLTARENLRFFGQMQGMGGRVLEYQIDRLLDVVGLADRSREAVYRFSAGMQRRLSVAVGLLGPPALLVLDEPTLGVDPQSRTAILDMVADLADAGTSVLLTTHYMDEVARVCDRVGIVDHGRMVAEGSVDELIASLGGGDRVRVGTAGGTPLAAGVAGLEGVRVMSMEPASVELLVDEASRRLPAIFDAARLAGAAIDSVDVRRPNLEDVFLTRTGRALRD